MMTKKQCEKILKERQYREYSLRHGEYARPESKIRKHTGIDSYGIITKYNYYPGTYNIRKNGWEDEQSLIYEYCMLKQAQRHD